MGAPIYRIKEFPVREGTLPTIIRQGTRHKPIDDGIGAAVEMLMANESCHHNFHVEISIEVLDT